MKSKKLLAPIVLSLLLATSIMSGCILGSPEPAAEEAGGCHTLSLNDCDGLQCTDVGVQTVQDTSSSFNTTEEYAVSFETDTTRIVRSINFYIYLSTTGTSFPNITVRLREDCGGLPCTELARSVVNCLGLPRTAATAMTEFKLNQVAIISPGKKYWASVYFPMLGSGSMVTLAYGNANRYAQTVLYANNNGAFSAVNTKPIFRVTACLE